MIYAFYPTTLFQLSVYSNQTQLSAQLGSILVQFIWLFISTHPGVAWQMVNSRAKSVTLFQMHVDLFASLIL